MRGFLRRRGSYRAEGVNVQSRRSEGTLRVIITGSGKQPAPNPGMLPKISTNYS